ncbi:DUF3298 and DUF4163 domain-containing protein [Neotamlana laminarinivorans]|uniref:DUF3298 and DUF4163 domain-containing protein n=1 Tax=Neotamlana laminarinivorans TaxID=2883124 RepID=A0A9X1L0W4_9FLAO|nr:DUF3298 and DUF4163 domain-containing protein [Tamlana laminarinivorans]MCB4798030.1 DUF3298 and DUF4163 domain-containing protein [Tamlana laminarinivorans]
MKKLLLLSICFFFICLTSCEKEQKSISFKEKTITTNSNKLVEVNTIEADGDSEVATKLNNTLKKSIISALHFGNLVDDITASSIEESIDEFNAAYIEFSKEFEVATPPWEAQIDTEVLYQSSEIISIAITTYTFAGGAHGNTYIAFKNFNPETGNTLQNQELFSDFNGFKTLAKNYFNKSIEDKSILFDPEKFDLPKNIAFTDEGLVLLYNIYEIGPYVAGITEFLIPYDIVAPYLAFNNF